MPPPLSSHTPYTTLFRSAPLSQHTEYLKVTAASAEEAIEHCAALVGRVRAEAGDRPVVGVVAAVPGRIAPSDGRVLSARSEERRVGGRGLGAVLVVLRGRALV